VIGEKRHLRWSDFRKVPHSLDKDSADAQTSVDLSYRIETASDANGNWRMARVTVTVRLDPHDTWVVRGKEHGPRNKQLLAHEQGHYDLAALAAITLHKKLSIISGDRDKDPAQEAAAVFRDIESDLESVNLRYDEDPNCGTKHGTRQIIQDAWQQGIRGATTKPDADVGDLMKFCPRDQSAPTGG
jgi:hypothetical protein